jgi:hypothetical protein
MNSTDILIIDTLDNMVKITAINTYHYDIMLDWIATHNIIKVHKFPLFNVIYFKDEKDLIYFKLGYPNSIGYR